MNDEINLVSHIALIKWLDATYPARPPATTDSLEKIHQDAGARRLVENLKATLWTQLQENQ